MQAALFAFNGDPMCFVHVLLNALDLKDRGYDVVIVIEGSATKLVETFHDDPDAPFIGLYQRVKEQGLIAGVCKACSAKMGVLEAVEAEQLPLLGDMSGHPSMGSFLIRGYKIYTF